MSEYQQFIGRNGEIAEGVIRLRDNAFIPADPRNPDWAAFQAWLAEGNQPLAPPPKPPAPDPQPNLQELAESVRELGERMTAVEDEIAGGR